MEFLSTWKTATGPTRHCGVLGGAVHHPPVVELLSDIPKGAVNSVKERVRKWLAEVHGIKLGRCSPCPTGNSSTTSWPTRFGVSFGIA